MCMYLYVDVILLLKKCAVISVIILCWRILFVYYTLLYNKNNVLDRKREKKNRITYIFEEI